MPSHSGRSGRSRRPFRIDLRSLAALAAAAVVLTTLTGCAGETPKADAASGASGAARADPPVRTSGAAGRWCGDEEWLMAAAGLYVSAYGKARHRVTTTTIDTGLRPGGPLRTGYRHLTGKGALPADLDLRELRDFLVTVAAAADVGTDPMSYTHHLIAVCDS